jgi:hypothetical protein
MVIERIANENCFDHCFVCHDMRRTYTRERCETRAATPKRSSPVIMSDVEDNLVRTADSKSEEGDGAKEGISGNQCTYSSTSTNHCLFKDSDHLYLCSLYWHDYLLPAQGFIH